ncbi:MAG: decaprenyl-phosphate phosphoribosyltransferase [Candidatus Hydrogenedentes bacterium]|nr:decaprenyl-phosphate phosphoribosyltransferase [Candidatus Hydrogenedentota bacterium]
MIATLITALRAYQWPKNLVVFGALVFAVELDDPLKVVKTIFAFAVLCAASSAVYVLNDIVDIEKDRSHPEKKNRPVASGALSVPIAALMVAVLAGLALTVAFLVEWKLGLATIAFLVLNLAYSLILKNIMLVDVLAIAVSFVIRGIAGALVIDVAFSNWLVVCTLFLALFLALGKRRREIGLLEEEAIKHREVLGHYTVPYLDALMIVLAGTTLLTYTIYTCSSEVVERLHTDKLYLTLPCVIYGLFRYLYLVHHKSGGGDPSRTLVRDAPLLAAVVLWGITNVAIIYGPRAF